jgi:hypothetical protein
MGRHCVSTSHGPALSVPTPRGRVLFQSEPESPLADVLVRVCSDEYFQDFVETVRDCFADGSGSCHYVAFEFAQARVRLRSRKASRVGSLARWRWVMAYLPRIGSEHSWIECDGEMFDVRRTVFKKTFVPVILCGYPEDLRNTEPLKAVESKSFNTFARWFESPSDSLLFRRHVGVSEGLLEHKHFLKRVGPSPSPRPSAAVEAGRSDELCQPSVRR